MGNEEKWGEMSGMMKHILFLLAGMIAGGAA